MSETQVEHSAGTLCSQPVEVPSNADLFYAIRAAFTVLHELSVKVTGGGFVIHDYLRDGMEFHSDMSMPVKITFPSEIVCAANAKDPPCLRGRRV